MHPAEQLIEETIVTTPDAGIDTDAMHALLLQTADRLRVGPLRMTDQGFIFHAEDRCIVLSPGHRRGRYRPTMRSSDWTERDNWEYRAFDYVDLLEDQPYFWRLELAKSAPGTWWPGKTVVKNWQQFFSIFAIYQQLPAALDAIPPAWRPPTESFGSYVGSMWNLASGPLNSIGVYACPGRLVLYGYARDGQTEFERQISVADIEQRGFDTTAFLAGLPETGRFADLQHFDTSGPIHPFPTTPGTEGSGPTPDQARLDDGGQPERKLSLTELDELLAKPLPEPRTAPQSEPIRLRPTLSGAQWVELIEKLATAQDASATLAEFGVEAKRHRKRVRSHQVLMSADERCFDRLGAWQHGNEITRALVARHGLPRAVQASSGAVTRIWQLPDGAGVEVNIQGYNPVVHVGEYQTLMALHY